MIRPTGLGFVHETVALSDPFPVPILDIQPVRGLPDAQWVALTETGELFWVDFDTRSVTLLAHVSDSQVDLTKAVTLHLSSDGRWAAIANTYGQFGLVVDLSTGLPTLKLNRGIYHVDVSKYPLAFFNSGSCPLLIHATDWNRLDISDPRTGERLTARPSPVYSGKTEEDLHYLDYFHCSLTVSPGQEWIADSGWVWHPAGKVVTWNLRQWLSVNVWESEDGPSRTEFCELWHDWGRPLCWIDDGTLAISGYGTDADHLIPAAVIFDAHTGKQLRWFPGPAGEFAFDRHLFAMSAIDGTTVWDVTTGERLLHDAEVKPLRYHHGCQQFLTVQSDGSFRLSRLVDAG